MQFLNLLVCWNLKEKLLMNVLRSQSEKCEKRERSNLENSQTVIYLEEHIDQEIKRLFKDEINDPGL